MQMTFYAIPVELVENAPIAVQKFCQDFFEEKKVFGKPCFVAISSDFKSPWIDMDDDEYLEGLTQEQIDDCGVFSWIDHHNQDFFEYSFS